MKPINTPVPPRNPCQSVCEIDPQTNFCKGCQRSQNEREWWPAYTDDQQREILRRCEQRREALQSGDALAPDMGPVVSRKKT